MIQHQSGHFVYNDRAAIRLPNGLCIDYFPDCTYADAFQLIAPDGSFRLLLGFHDVEKDARTFLEELSETFDQFTILEPVHAIENRKGILGYATAYALSSEICEEVSADLPGEPQALFFARFWRTKDKPFDQELYEQAKAELLQQLRFINPEWRNKQPSTAQLLQLPYPKNLILTLEADTARELIEPAEEAPELLEGILLEIPKLSVKEQTVLRLRFEERKPRREISEILGFRSPERARQIELDALRHLRDTELLRRWLHWSL